MICGNRPFLFACAALAGSWLPGLPPAAQQPVPVPSGQPVALFEVLVDDTPGEVWVRFRFVAPEISGDDPVPHDAASADMDELCRTFALPYLADYGLDPVRIAISLSDREVEFGASDPSVTQFFEVYRPEGDACVWEGF